MPTKDEDVRQEAIEKLDHLAALSGWKAASEHLDAMIKVDSFLQRSEGEVH